MPLAGKSVLDIGCWDGYFSLEALWRGAGRVVSTDHYVWNTQWSRGSFDLVRERLSPKMEAQDIDVYDISPASVGRFDVVLFAGVLYHLRHPLLGLEKAASVCRDTLVIETVLDALSLSRPAMVFYPGGELKGDPSNWWGPNRLLVEAMLRNLGFKEITFTPTPIPRKWTLFDYVKRNPAITPRGAFTPAGADLSLMLHCDGLGSADCLGWRARAGTPPNILRMSRSVPVKVKICGVRSPEFVDAAVEAGADYVGVVFFERSPRNVTLAEAALVTKSAAGRIRSVAVLVDPDEALIEDVIAIAGPDMLQLHGSETPERVSEYDPGSEGR